MKRDLQRKTEEVESLRKELQASRQESESLRYDLRRAESETQSLKESKVVLEEGAVVRQEELLKLSMELESKHSKAMKEAREAHELELGQQLGEAREQIAMMEKDMHLIKESWEGKCQ